MNMQQNKVWWPLALLMMMASIVLRLSTISLEVFLHYGFGERYFRLVDLILGVSALSLAGHFAQVLAPESFKQILFLGNLVLALGIIHIVLIQRRKKKGIVIHSRYWGNSWPLFYKLGLSHQTIQHFVEPLLCLVIGVLIAVYTPGLLIGSWIVIGSVCWAVLCQIETWRWNSRILDALDHEIEARQFEAAVVDRKAPQETQGFFAPVSPNFTQAQRSTLKNAFENLDPKLKAMMEDSPEEIFAKAVAD